MRRNPFMLQGIVDLVGDALRSVVRRASQLGGMPDFSSRRLYRRSKRAPQPTAWKHRPIAARTKRRKAKAKARRRRMKA